MPEGEDWLLAPVEAGMCKYESLKDLTLDLEDVARMYDLIEVKRENEIRFRKANDER